MKIVRWILAAIAIISIIGSLSGLGGAANKAGLLAVAGFWTAVLIIVMRWEKRSQAKK